MGGFEIAGGIVWFLGSLRLVVCSIVRVCALGIDIFRSTCRQDTTPSGELDRTCLPSFVSSQC
ncbi:hypothetical protein QUB47_00715 [Microcoleus sp. AT9_B5]